MNILVRLDIITFCVILDFVLIKKFIEKIIITKLFILQSYSVTHQNFHNLLRKSKIKNTKYEYNC